MRPSSLPLDKWCLRAASSGGRYGKLLPVRGVFNWEQPYCWALKYIIISSPWYALGPSLKDVAQRDIGRHSDKWAKVDYQPYCVLP